MHREHRLSSIGKLPERVQSRVEVAVISTALVTARMNMLKGPQPLDITDE
jgi:hypothetical protein